MELESGKATIGLLNEYLSNVNLETLALFPSMSPLNPLPKKSSKFLRRNLYIF